MTHEEIMEMPIENVEEIEWAGGRTIDIWFDLNGIRCHFYVSRTRNNVYRVSTILYDDFIDCPFCNQEETYCTKLEAHKTIIFERVIQSNSIRLNWLFRAYTFG